MANGTGRNTQQAEYLNEKDAAEDREEREPGEYTTAGSYEAEANFAQRCCRSSGLDWWRRRESNPRPKMLLVKSLHA